MAESQSRYSIMEEFNQKKINARKRLADLDKAVAEEETKYTQLVQNNENSINNEENNYKTNFKNWKTNRELAIKLATRKHEEMVTTMKQLIADKEAAYEDDHKDTTKALEQKKKDTVRNYTQFTKYKELDKKAINAEIKEIDSAIQSLKDISIAQPSA